MHMRRFANNMRNLRHFIRNGGLGDIRGVSGWCIKGAVHNGTHWFDLLRYLLGVEVSFVSGLDMLKEEGDDPTLDVAMFLDNGMLATMRAAEHANFTICEMDIMGTRGRAQIVDSSYRVDISEAVPSPRYTGYVELVPSPIDMGDRKDVMLHAVEDIVRCLETGGMPESTGEDGVEALRIALAAHESARMDGRVVEVTQGRSRA
jgi:predicted dehydrogenase